MTNLSEVCRKLMIIYLTNAYPVDFKRRKSTNHKFDETWAIRPIIRPGIYIPCSKYYITQMSPSDIRQL